jgi:hypothetical protein
MIGRQTIGHALPGDRAIERPADAKAVEIGGGDSEADFIKRPFDKAIKDGLLPANLNTIAGHGAQYTTQAN